MGFRKRVLVPALLLAAAVPAAGAGLDEALAAYQGGEYREAFVQFKHLAIRGDAEAQFQLGSMYGLGQGVAENQAQAARWLREAAEQEHRAAAESLGKMYLSGLGVERNEEEGLKWLEMARQIAERNQEPPSSDCD